VPVPFWPTSPRRQPMKAERVILAVVALVAVLAAFALGILYGNAVA